MTPDQVDQRTRLRALLSSAIGGVVEWYDYFLYGTMAGIIFGPLFFPTDDPVVSQALSFASFALAFVVRPIGGIIFSHIGDRIGRKKTLVATLSLMGGSTVAMGLLPTYEAVGAWITSASDRNLISEQHRPGSTTLYTLTDTGEARLHG